MSKRSNVSLIRAQTSLETHVYLYQGNHCFVAKMMHSILVAAILSASLAAGQIGIQKLWLYFYSKWMWVKCFDFHILFLRARPIAWKSCRMCCRRKDCLSRRTVRLSRWKYGWKSLYTYCWHRRKFYEITKYKDYCFDYFFNILLIS